MLFQSTGLYLPYFHKNALSFIQKSYPSLKLCLPFHPSSFELQYILEFIKFIRGMKYVYQSKNPAIQLYDPSKIRGLIDKRRKTFGFQISLYTRWALLL